MARADDEELEPLPIALGVGEASDLVDSWLSCAWGKKIGISNQSLMEPADLVGRALLSARARPLGPHFCKALRIRCQFVKQGEDVAAVVLEPVLEALAQEELIDFSSDMGVRNQSFAHWAARSSLPRLMAAISKADPIQFDVSRHYLSTAFESGVLHGSSQAMHAFIELCDPDMGLIWARTAREKIVAALGFETPASVLAMRLEAKAEARLVGAAAGAASSGSSMRI